MFCPRCGDAEQEADSYCKRCGQWLEGGGERAWYEVGRSSPEAYLKTMQSYTITTAVLALGCGVALFLSLVTKTGLYFWGGLVSVYCIMLAGMQFWSFYLGRRLQKRMSRARGQGSKGLAQSPPAVAHALGAADTSHFAPARGVTESTTELLEPMPHRRPEGGETG